MFKNRFIFIVLHIIMWIGYTVLPVLTAFSNEANKYRVNPYTYPIYWVYVAMSSIFLFYINSEVLFPYFYKRKQNLKYILCLIMIIVIMIIGRFYIRVYISNDINFTLFYANVFIQYLYVFAISASYCFFTEYQKQQEIQQGNENERLKSELSFLRSQISPHFIFNLLNSLVSLNRKKSDMVEPVLLKMSDILRYMLYEKEDKQISLSAEIRYLSSYIDLQKIRFGDHVTVELNIDVPVIYNIEPMLLIPFVENAFKHGIGMIEKPFIKVELKTTNEELFFKVTNKFSTNQINMKDGASGIGINNVKRRLELLYPQKFILSIYKEKEDSLYIADLRLNIK